MRPAAACCRSVSAVAQPAGPAPATSTSNSGGEFISTFPGDGAHSIQIIILDLDAPRASAPQHIEHLLDRIRAADRDRPIVARDAAAEEWKAGIDQCQMQSAAS